MSELVADSSNKKKGLGRGLGSLLGGPAGEAPTNSSNNNVVPKAVAPSTSPSLGATPVAPPVDPESKIWKVAIDKLSPGQYQPRRQFGKEALQELAQSIRENGILQPIVARRIANGKLEIVAGERRWRAAQIAGQHEVPVILRSFTDKEALELAIVENIQREDLNPIEEAEGYQPVIQ
jgi:ParB family chromosome partitioning protein